MLLPRRVILGLLSGAAFGATPQERKQTMAPAAPPDEKRLQAFYDTLTKYNAAPVPTPLNRAAAIAFVNSKTNRTTSPEKMGKLVRLAVFYNLRETSQTFSAVLTGNENQPADIIRAALCLIALAWIGDAGQQTAAQQYFHGLQERADVELHRATLLEVVEAFGPREGTGFHRQWIQTAIVFLQGQLQQAQTNRDIPRSKLRQEKINALTEYLNIQLALVDRAFSRRQRIDAMAQATQIQPLVACSLGTLKESTPQLSYWASMRLLRLEATLRAQIAGEFSAASSAHASDDLIHARALRAAEYFGYALPEPDRKWLASQPDTGTDPLALRARYYKV